MTQCAPLIAPYELPPTPPTGTDFHPTPLRVARASTLPIQGRVKKSHRHLAMSHRGACGEALRRLDDGVGVDVVVAIEIVDAAGLAEMLDAQSLEAMAAHAAEPAQARRMAVDHGDDAAIARQRRQQFFDVARMFRATVLAADLSRRGPARVQAIRRGD